MLLLPILRRIIEAMIETGDFKKYSMLIFTRFDYIQKLLIASATAFRFLAISQQPTPTSRLVTCFKARLYDSLTQLLLTHEASALFHFDVISLRSVKSEPPLRHLLAIKM
jgi:hypothetical protein